MDNRSKRRVFVAGWGLVTPLGVGAWGTFQGLLAGKTLHSRFKMGNLPEDPFVLAQRVGAVGGVGGGVGRVGYASGDPAIGLAELAAREALQMAGVGAEDCAILLATSKGAVSALAGALDGGGVGRAGVCSGGGPRPTVGVRDAADRALAVALGPCGYLTHHLGLRLGVRPMQHQVAACASSLASLHQARLMLLHGGRGDDGVKRVLVVSSEASLLPIYVYSYRKLGVLPELTGERYVGWPLDERRDGFVLAESASAVVLELIDDEGEGIIPGGWIEVLDSAVGCEGHDLIRPSPKMDAVKDVARRMFSGRRIDLVHPHATGTASHDPTELCAIAEGLDQGEPVDVYANKGAIGHGLGSSGLASLVIACMCGRSGRRPPMPWLEKPIDPKPGLMSIGREGHERDIDLQGVFAAGFGGHVAGAVLRTHRRGG